MSSQRCKAKNRDGTRCKRMTTEGLRCEIHQRMIDRKGLVEEEKKRQRSELEKARGLQVSTRNRGKIDFLLSRPEFDFKNEDLLVTWLIEKARMSEPTLRLLLDVYEQQARM